MAIRVYQVAKEYSRSTDEVINILREAGIKVSSQTTALDEHALHTLQARFGQFKVTVVDGDNESKIAMPEPEVDAQKPAKAKRAGKKKELVPEPPPPKMTVRVIKKHEDESVGDTKTEEKPKLIRRRLQKPKGLTRIEDRIQQASERRGSQSMASSEVKPPRPRPIQSSSVASSNNEGHGQKHDAQAKSANKPFRRPGKRSETPIEVPIFGQQGPAKPRRGGPVVDNDNYSSSRAASIPGGPSSRLGDSPGRNRFGPNKTGPKKRKRKKSRNVEHMEKIQPVSTTNKVELPTEDLGIIMLSEGATVKELAEKVNRKAKDVIKRLFEKGILATLNDVLEGELAIEIAKDFGYLAEIVSFEEDLQIREDEDLIKDDNDDSILEPRAPIVTIMGHVDHGKTTLLDAIRKAKVAIGEAGGITQHIGAYTVPYNNKHIVFLDTPGHEAFTKMRARGASVTDIVVLVVAADDGVKPQTVEAINHAKAAKVPIITCINKIDKPEANPERVKQMLTEHELVVEEFGGDSPCVQVSAKTQVGIDDLLEMILLVAELNDYRAHVTRKARGTVIEAQLDRGRGPVATVVVQDGTIKVGDYFITGQTYGKIRAMHDDLGRNVDEAKPSTPVEILGLQEVPSAGDIFQVLPDEATARKISSFRKERAREDQLRRQHTSLDQLFSNLKPTGIKDLPVIIKADVHGSVEGLIFALTKIKSEKVNLRIVHHGVGNITENDVLLAVAADAIIIGFNIKPERGAQELAEHEGIDVRLYSVIYEVVKEVEAAMLGLVAPTFEERSTGRASVKQVFSVAKLGKVAGCVVESGVVKRSALVRVLRNKDQIYQGTLQTLKRFKDDVNEVKNGYECGIGINGFSDVEEGDILEFFEMEEVKATKL